MRSWIRNYWFLATLLAVLLCGFGIPDRLRPIAEIPWLPELLVAGVLFITSLPHDFSAIRRTLRDPGPAALAITINAVAIPLAAWPLSWLLPEPFRLGLLVAAAVPSTLASAAVWTRRAGGNDLIPIVVTGVTNLACFAVSPFWIWLFTDRQSMALDPRAMVVRLIVLVLIPILAAQGARHLPAVALGTARHHRLLGFLSQCGILLMVGIGIVQSGAWLARGSNPGVGLTAWLAMGGIVLALHLAAWWLGWWGAGVLGASRPDRIGVSFAGSQKTLMVGLHLAVSLGGGLILLPILTYHVLQLVADTVLADYLRRDSADAL